MKHGLDLVILSTFNPAGLYDSFHYLNPVILSEV